MHGWFIQGGRPNECTQSNGTQAKDYLNASLAIHLRFTRTRPHIIGKMAPAKMEDQLTLVGRMLEEESSKKREEIEARHAQELRELLRAQAKELKEFEISAQEKKEAKLNDVKAKFQGEKVENTTIQQDDRVHVEKKGHGKINSCPACNELSCSTNNVQRRPCACCDVVLDNLSSLCDGCADKMNLKAAICGHWTCIACHDSHVQGCRLCKADEGESWFMGN